MDTLDYLKRCNVKVMYNDRNIGPWINPYINEHIYNALPEKFIYTDPDLQFHPNMPANFVDILNEISEKYEKYKVGLALDISDYEKMYNYVYNEERSQTIWEWEQQFWDNKVDNNDYELYNADIDTTFVFVNKKYSIRDVYIRVAGDLTAKHIPWYMDNSIYNVYDRYNFCNKTTDISTTSKVIRKYLNSHYIRINKNNDFILIKNDDKDQNFSFWTSIYHSWESETFSVFDDILSKDKIFID